MEIEGAKILQLLIPDFNLKDIIKEEFLEDLEAEYEGNVRVVGLNIVLGDSGDMATITHLLPEYEKENKIVVDVRNTEHLKILFDTIKKHSSEG